MSFDQLKLRIFFPLEFQLEEINSFNNKIKNFNKIRNFLIIIMQVIKFLIKLYFMIRQYCNNFNNNFNNSNFVNNTKQVFINYDPISCMIFFKYKITPINK